MTHREIRVGNINTIMGMSIFSVLLDACAGRGSHMLFPHLDTSYRIGTFSMKIRIIFQGTCRFIFERIQGLFSSLMQREYLKTQPTGCEG